MKNNIRIENIDEEMRADRLHLFSHVVGKRKSNRIKCVKHFEVLKT